MRPRWRNLHLALNAAGYLSLGVTDMVGVPIDLSAYGARAMIRGAYTDLQPYVSLTLGSGIALGANLTPGSPTNYMTIAWTADEATAVLKALNGAEGVWDLWFDPAGSPDETSWLAVKGKVLEEDVATR